jgi:translation initiation factor 3 subunit D
MDLKIHFNQDGWGPNLGEKISVFDEVPYAHFDKKDRIGRPADFIQNANASNYPRNYYQRKRDGMNTTDFSFRHDLQEDKEFQLVDTSKTQSKSKLGTTAKRQAGRNQQNNRNRTVPLVGRKDDQNEGMPKENVRSKMNQQGKRRMAPKDRMPSLAVAGHWNMIEEFDLAQLLKLQTNLPAVEDLAWCGHIDQYDESYDKLTTRIAKNLRRMDNVIHYDVTSKDDPYLEKFCIDGVGHVYATDSIIAQLMAAPRSVYSWDIVIDKTAYGIFMDKRENSNFDLLTVSETSQEPPIINEETDPINTPEKLSLEATSINQNFSQQILLDGEGCRKNFEPNPFFDESEPGVQPASVAYRYRKFTLGAIKLVTRCEIHSWALKKKSEEESEELLMNVHCLNEWDSR